MISTPHIEFVQPNGQMYSNVSNVQTKHKSIWIHMVWYDMIWPVSQSFSNLVLPRCLPKRTRRKIRTARLARVSVKLDKKVSKLFWLVGPWIEHIICRPRIWLRTFKHGVLWCTYVAAFGWSGAVPFMLTCTPEGENTHSEKNVTNKTQ